MKETQITLPLFNADRSRDSLAFCRDMTFPGWRPQWRRPTNLVSIRTVAASEDLDAWDRVAAAYAKGAGQASDATYQRFHRFLWEHLGEDLSGKRLLDVGCGHGWLAEAGRSRGASVVGVDGSRELLAMARTRYPGIEFKQADLTQGLPPSVSSQTFDRVVAHMVVMDLATLEPLATSLRQCVAADGVVVVTLPHPSFFLQSPMEDASTGERYRKVTGYLDPAEWWITTFGGHRHYHRPLEFYVKWLASAGLAVFDLNEPPVPLVRPEGDQDDHDRWFVTIPTMLGLAAVPMTRS